MPKITVSILGCGWLGLPLGRELIGSGYLVKGSTTSTEKLDKIRKEGITPYSIHLDSGLKAMDLSFFECDVLIVTIPPRNGRYESQLCTVRDAVQDSIRDSIRDTVLSHGTHKILFISSSAVYPNLNGVVTEEDADENSLTRAGVSLVKMEKIFTENTAFDTTVIRFGGLIGPERHPGRFLAGKSALPGRNNPVNMIHLDDCIGVIQAVMARHSWNEIYNACAPVHPTREEFYSKAAQVLGMEPPAFSDQEAGYKEVSVEKLLTHLKYQFRYSDPLASL